VFLFRNLNISIDFRKTPKEKYGSPTKRKFLTYIKGNPWASLKGRKKAPHHYS